MKRTALRTAISCLLILSLVLCGCGQTAEPIATITKPVAEAVYPEMAPYPQTDPGTGMIKEGFGTLGGDSGNSYDAWRDSLQSQRNQPEGYADGLSRFFCRSIPFFLPSGQGNRVCSPLNLYMALALLAESTSGASRQQILDALDTESLEALRTQAQQVWNAHYCNDKANTCILANSLWLNEGMPYNQNTLNTLAEKYYASVFQGPMGSVEMNKVFQDWLNEQTGGLLEGQVNQLNLDPQTVLALATTIFYQAKWDIEFSPENNTEDIFHAPSGDRTVTYLNRQLTYGPYFWGEGFAAAYLRLEDDSLMWLILPDEGVDPQEVLRSGLAMDMILNHAGDYADQASIKVNLSMPKFDITSDTEMKQALNALGITEIFSPEQADFSSILPESAAWLDRIQHAARVMVDEEGVSAAAYTAMMLAGAARPPEDEVDFVLDRPFLFVITSHDSLPLFAGIVNEP